MQKIKIMFVCTGNICRSAMADKMLAKRVEEENLNIEVYSSGTFAENGDYPTVEAIEAMEEYGVDLKQHRATNIRRSNIEEMDLILCATTTHKNMVLQLYPNLVGQVYTMKEYVGDTQNGIDISDPWGYDLAVYRKCAAEIEKIIKKIVDKMKNA